MAVKFPLKMADEARVKTLEELREHFDLAAVLGYYDDGRLIRWLRNGFYDKEAEQVETLDKSMGDFVSNLCEILGVAYQENLYGRVDLDDIIKRNNRIERLRRFTADAEILNAVDRVAFSQKELDALACKGEKEIYLCGEYFTIPSNIEDVVYIGVNNPAITFEKDRKVAAGINIQGMKFNIEDYIGDGDYDTFLEIFYHNLELGIKLLLKAVENESAFAKYSLGMCYYRGWGMEQNDEEAVKWLLKAAEQGNANAQYELGEYYMHGIYFEEDEEKENHMKAVKWLLKAAEQGNANAQYALGEYYMHEDEEEAIKWYQKSAEQGNATAQDRLGFCYEYGQGVKKDKEEAVKWYRKAAEQGDINGLDSLGKCYYCGIGVEKDKEEAIKWYQKSVDRGNIFSQFTLRRIIEEEKRY